ncbi:hypothetical protein BGX27_005979 [Mortierella sp. AM989]|nr:hypothetical protein BGX27_005979 [Mortierella sp. AM989]
MSSEETPPPPTNGNGAPIKLSFGGTKGFNLAKKKAPLVNKSASAAFGHQEEKVDAHKDELIAGLDGNKIESLERTEKAQLLVIPKLENADWRQQVLSKRKNIFTPQESGTLPVGTVDETTKEVKYGLQIMKRKRVDQDTEIGDDNMQTETSTLTTTTTIEVMEDILMEQKEETLDEQAARKVIEAATGQRSEEARRLILQGQQNVEDVEAFQKNLEELPDEATLDDYEKVPVEEFGAALLRGMGWNGDIKGSEA